MPAAVALRSRPVKLVGLGGGIGSGKSSASALLRALGAVVIDADAIAREVVEPGTHALRLIAERFGSALIKSDGTLDRAALAGIVFSDKDALADLNAITHPAIEREMMRRVALNDTAGVVVYDAALPFRTDPYVMVGRIVVDIDYDIAVQRLVQFRNFSPDDARARIAAQISRHERLASADFVIDNSGSPDDLVLEVGRAWAWIATLPES